MRCFEVNEGVRPGLRVERFPEPHVRMQGREPLYLDPKMGEAIRQIPPNEKGMLLLHEAAPVFHQGGRLTLASVPPEWHGSDSKALVLVSVYTPLGGQIALTADCYVQEITLGKSGLAPLVARTWLPFATDQSAAPVGINVLAGSPDTLAFADDDDVSWIEVLLTMEQGASFRITREGDLNGASPVMIVRWQGRRLDVQIPRRFQARHADPEAPRKPRKKRAAAG